MKTLMQHGRRCPSRLWTPLLVLAFAILSAVVATPPVAGETIRVTNGSGRKVVVRTRAAGSQTWSDGSEIPPTRPNAVPTPVLIELGEGDASDILCYSYGPNGVTVFDLGSLRVRDLVSALGAFFIYANKLGTFHASQDGDWTFEEGPEHNALRVGATTANRRLSIYIQ